MMDFRPLTLHEADLVCRWIGDSLTFFHWSAGLLGVYPLQSDELLARYRELTQSCGLMPFMVYENGVPVGHITIRHPHPANDEWRIGFVLVNPDVRGKGVGKRMIRELMAHIAARYPANRFSIGVFLGNAAAYRCYTSLGFAEDKASDKIIQTADGTDTYRLLYYGNL